MNGTRKSRAGRSVKAIDYNRMSTVGTTGTHEHDEEDLLDAVGGLPNRPVIQSETHPEIENGTDDPGDGGADGPLNSSNARTNEEDLLDCSIDQEIERGKRLKEITRKLKQEKLQILKMKNDAEERRIEELSDGNQSMASGMSGIDGTRRKKNGGPHKSTKTLSKAKSVTIADLRGMKDLEAEAEIIARQAIGSYDVNHSDNGKPISSYHNFQGQLRKFNYDSAQAVPSKHAKTMPYQAYSCNDDNVILDHDFVKKPSKSKLKTKRKRSNRKVRESSDTDTDIEISSDAERYDFQHSSVSHSDKPNPKHLRLKSGKERSITDSVVNPIKWPHTGLKCAVAGNNINFQSLDPIYFVAGYLGNLNNDISTQARVITKLQIAFLVRLMYFSKIHEWGSVLSYSEAVFNEIERANRSWNDNFYDLEFLLKPISKPSVRSFKSSTGTNQDWFCSNFQRNDCQQTAPHTSFFHKDGVHRKVDHFCATCWSLEGVKKPHSSSDCKIRGQAKSGKPSDL